MTEVEYPPMNTSYVAELKTRRRIFGLIGSLLVIAVGPVFLIGWLKVLYHTFILPRFAANVMRLIWDLPLVPFLWNLAPLPGPRGGLSTFFNFYFGTAFGLLLAGIYILDKGRHLGHLIARARDQSMVDRMAGYQHSRTTVELEFARLAEDTWWTHPVGVVVLAIVSGIVSGLFVAFAAQYIMLRLGWIH